MRKRVLISDKIDKNVISSFSSLIFDYQPEIDSLQLLKIIDNYQGLVVRSRTKVTKEIIEAGKNLKVIGRVGTGLDNIDVETAKKHKIVVVNAPGANSNAVAELTLGLILSLLRHLSQAYLSMKEKKWLKKELSGEELAGKTVGIVGYGKIGEKVAKLVKSFGAKVLYYSRSKKNTSLKNLFQKSDIVSLHLPATPETINLVDINLLSLMKPTSFLVNTARAKIIVEKDLLKVVSSKKIAGVAVDVFWEEPLPADSPWRKLDNVILTPHLGASTTQALATATKIVLKKVVEILK